MLLSRPRLAAALLAVVVAGAALVGVPIAGPAHADAPASCTNSGCPDPTNWKDERWNAHAGYPSFGGTVNGMNCTNYVAWRLIKSLGFTTDQVRGLGNATSWDTNAAHKGYTVNNTPAVGAVAQWNANHVAFVEQINGDGTIVISESNTWVGSSSNRKWLRFRTVSVSSVDNFIHFRPPPLARSIIAPGDFDGDGLGDLLSIRYDGTLTAYAGDGDGGFLDPAGTRIGTGWHKFKTAFAAGDFSGDHKADVMAITTDGKLFLYRGDGAGGWSGARTKIGSAWHKFKFVFAPGDFSGDGAADVLGVRADGRLVLFSGNGSGGWKGRAITIATGFASAKRVTSPGDFDGDGRPDVIALWSDGTVKLYPGNGSNGLLDPAGIVIATGWTDVRLFTGRGDVSGDGHTDLLTLNTDGRTLLFAGDGAGLPDPGIPLSIDG